MLKTPTRPKRNLECDADMERGYNNGPSLASFASMKRIRIEPLTPSGSGVSTHISYHANNCGGSSSLAESRSQERSDIRDKLDEDMEVGDEIVSNFNTISFDSSLLQAPQSHDVVEKSSSPYSSPSTSKGFPGFPPLQRSGRKIDHLVDEVIRKSSRYNPECLRLTIPPSDFEFHMPSHVSACGSPNTDARYISSPENRNLAVAAIYNATTSPPMLDKPKLIQLGDSSLPLNSQGEREEMLETNPSSSFAQYHLGDVTHSDWFENSSGGRDNGVCRSGLQHNPSFANPSTASYCREYDHEDSDEENCEDMYIDS